MSNYGTEPQDFVRGDRVKLHPATDLFMRGAVYGNVTGIGRQYVTVQLDRVARPVKIKPCNLTWVREYNKDGGK